MQQIIIKTYSFDELSDEAKQKAIEANRNREVEYWEWWHNIEDEIQGRLAKEGYGNIEIGFSGFWSQGDGAHFTAKIDLALWLKVAKKANQFRALYNLAKKDELEVELYRQSTHYEHAYTVNITDDVYGLPDKTGSQLDRVKELILEEAREYMKQLYRDLEQEYEYLTSDEVIADVLTSNEVQFLEDGSENYYV